MMHILSNCEWLGPDQTATEKFPDNCDMSSRFLAKDLQQYRINSFRLWLSFQLIRINKHLIFVRLFLYRLFWFDVGITQG